MLAGPNPDGTPRFTPSFDVAASLPIPSGQANIAVEVAVDIYCLRAGVNLPDEGFVGIDLRDERTKPIFPMDPYWMTPTPLSLNMIEVTVG